MPATTTAARPHIRQMFDQPVAVIETLGNPTDLAPTIFGAFRKLVQQEELAHEPVAARHIRARWATPQPAERTRWRTRWALPIARMDQLLAPSVDGYVVRRELWKYGTVAEGIHMGTYETLAQTDTALRAGIADSGYAINGDHEEEYRDADGTNPHTVIRYPVAPRAEE